MVSKSHARRKQDIKSKLMAAIAMLLVSSIMMVSSTYAWFTLSTAPEVTGITTQVGANGNLEMALLPVDGISVSESGGLAKKDLTYGITSGTSDSMSIDGKDVKESNVTWGNLVNLETGYGLDKIVLYPSELNVNEYDVIDVVGGILKTPKYGSDGRVSELAANTSTGVYSALEGETQENFYADNNFGVRAIGVASGMTDRQIAYRNARSAATTAMTSARNTIVNSLTSKGAELANIAVKHATASGADETYTQAEVQNIIDAVADLKVVLGYIDTAYMQYILAYSASSAVTEEAAWGLVSDLVNAPNVTLDSVLSGLADITGVSALPSEITAILGHRNTLAAAIATAEDELPPTQDSYVWGDFDAALDALINTTYMTVNGWKIGDIKSNQNDFIQDYIQQRELLLLLPSQSGVYSDIADHVGDYDANIKLDIAYGENEFSDIPAKMQTASTVDTPYVSQFSNAASAGAPSAGDGAANPFSDFYGYIIDLAFRTNATGSYLQVQQQPADRIYSDNNNEETMGNGSTMTFKAGSENFTNDQMLNLMDAVRIVFFDPMTGEIVAKAKLDTRDTGDTAYSIGENGITAYISLYDTVVTYTYQQNDDGNYYLEENVDYKPLTELTDYTGKIYAPNSDGEGYVESESGTYGRVVLSSEYKPLPEDATEETHPYNIRYAQVANAAGSESYLTDVAIMELQQGTAHALSVLVYLDGNLVENKDVATGELSLTGKLNLQFSSSATLTPMEYSALHTPGANQEPANP